MSLVIDTARFEPGVKMVVNGLKVQDATLPTSSQQVAEKGVGRGLFALLPGVLRRKNSQDITTERRASATTQASYAQSVDGSQTDKQNSRSNAAKLREHQQDDRFEGCAVDFVVEDSTVTPKGTVSDVAQQQLVITDARFAPGVKGVASQFPVQVAPAASPSDSSNGQAEGRIRVQYEVIMNLDEGDRERLLWTFQTGQHSLASTVTWNPDDMSMELNSTGASGKAEVHRKSVRDTSGYTETLTLRWPDGSAVAEQVTSSSAQKEQ